MKRFGLSFMQNALIGLLFSAVLSIHAVQADEATPDAGRVAWLLGTWSCANNAGTDSTWKFTRNVDGSLHLNNQYRQRVAGGGEFNEQFRFDAVKQQWQWSADQLGGPIRREFASAKPWTGQAWDFEGTYWADMDAPPGSIRPVHSSGGTIHLRYAEMSDSQFVRTMDLHSPGMATQTVTVTCRRATL